MTQVVAVAAIGKNRELGKSGELVWRIPDDLKRFKALTLGHPVIMGRKTFDSIIRALGKPLPGRTSIVVTRDTSWAHEGVVVAHSIEDAIEKGKSLDGERVCVVGGAEIYQRALPYADVLELTLIDAEDKNADAFFPPYEDQFATVLSDESREYEGLKYRWVAMTQ